MPRYSYAQREPREDPAAVVGLALRLADAQVDDFYKRAEYDMEVQRHDLNTKSAVLNIAKTQMDLDRERARNEQATGAYAYFSGLDPSKSDFGAAVAQGVSQFPEGRMDRDVSKLIDEKWAAHKGVKASFQQSFGEDLDPDAFVTPEGKFDVVGMHQWSLAKKQRSLAEQRGMADMAKGLGAGGIDFTASGQPRADFRFADDKDRAEMARALAAAGVTDPKESDALLADPIAANRRIGMALREQVETKQEQAKRTALKSSLWKQHDAIKFDKLDLPGTPGYDTKAAQKETLQQQIRQLDEGLPAASPAASTPATKVRVRHPDGRTGFIKAENLDAALKNGFKKLD